MMVAIKEWTALGLVLLAFGIASDMDYDDAVARCEYKVEKGYKFEGACDEG